MKYIVIITLAFTAVTIKAQVNEYDKPSGQKYQSTYVPQDIGFYERMYKEKHEQELAQQKKDQQFAQDKMNRIKQLYYNAPKYPASIPDGFYKGIIMDNIESVFSMELYVTNNKVTHIAKDGIKLEETTFSSLIDKGKAVIKLNFPGGELTYLDVYFIDYIYKGSY